jgi:hypothetical protein
MFAYSQELLRVLEERSAAGDTFVLPSGESQQQQPGDKVQKKAPKAAAAATAASTAAGNGHTEHNGINSGEKQPSEFSLMCARKFRRLRQELASHALDGAPAVAAASAHSAAAASASATAAPLGAPPRGEAVCLLGGYRSQHYSDSSTSSGAGSSSGKRKRDAAEGSNGSTTATSSASTSSGGDGDTDGESLGDAPAAVVVGLVTEQWTAVRGALMTALGHATSRQPVALPAEAVLTLLRCYKLEPLAVSFVLC